MLIYILNESKHLNSTFYIEKNSSQFEVPWIPLNVQIVLTQLLKYDFINIHFVCCMSNLFHDWSKNKVLLKI